MFHTGQLKRENGRRHLARDLHGVWPWFLCAAVTSGGMVVASLIQPWVEPSLLYRDLFAEPSVKRYTGFISNIGVFLWCSTAAICLFAALILYEVSGASRRMWLLVYFGVLSGLFLVDDFFMVHETSKAMFGIPPEAFIGMLMVILIAGLGFFLHELVQLDWPLLFGALAMFGASVVVDVVNDGIPAPNALLYVAEDAPKLLGIAFWAAFFARGSLLSVIATCGAETRATGGRHRARRTELARNTKARGAGGR